MHDPLDRFPAFVEAVRERLEVGRRVYGDRSFERPPVELLAELEAEALDLAGWGFVLFERLRAEREMAERAATLELQLPPEDLAAINTTARQLQLSPSELLRRAFYVWRASIISSFATRTVRKMRKGGRQ